MPRRPDGDRAMTPAERQRLYRTRLAAASGPRPTIASLREENERLRHQHALLVVTIWHLVPGSQVGSGGR